jgi:DNA-binding transcriptional regulator YdaS (Cro superfamily)
MVFAMTLKQAVKKLGGPSKVARLIGISRTTLIYWLTTGVPGWRKGNADAIIAMAQETGDKNV